MLSEVNIAANAVIFLGAAWAVLTHKVPTRTFGCAVLGVVAITAILNMDSRACHSMREVAQTAAVALGVLWAFWKLEVRPLLQRSPA